MQADILTLQTQITYQSVDGLMTLAKAAEFKDVEDMDESERLAIAVIAGVETISAINERGNLEIRTRWPVGIQKINGKFMVTEAPRRKKH